MKRLALVLLVSGCTTDAEPITGEDGGMTKTDQTTLTRTVCSGVGTNERPRCDVPGVGPDNPPIVGCWRQHDGAWLMDPVQGTELVTDAVYCPPVYMGWSWRVVVLSATNP